MSENSDEAKRISDNPGYWSVHMCTHVALRLMQSAILPGWKVTGRHCIPLRGPVLVCPNHISDADPPLMAISSWRPMWYMAKKELFEIPGFGKFIPYLGAFPVNRGAPDRTAMRHAEKLLSEGQAVVVFPEGHVSSDGETKPVLPGAVMLALRAKVPVIPVGISGTPSVIPYGSVIPRPTKDKVHIHYAEPINFDDLTGMKSRDQRRVANERLTEAMHAAIAYSKKN